jgi:hypothetical protein
MIKISQIHPIPNPESDKKLYRFNGVIDEDSLSQQHPYLCKIEVNELLGEEVYVELNNPENWL